MKNDTKASLRRIQLERRDNTSEDMLNIAAEKIQNRLKEIKAYHNAKDIGIYYSIGSEIPTRHIIEELISSGRHVCLPKVTKGNIEFKEITDFANLERGSFGIMEPKDRCPTKDSLDVVLVPAICMAPNGARLGYGLGFYDRYLEMYDTPSIALLLEKQMVRNIQQTNTDRAINWIVTEYNIYDTSQAK